MNHLIERLREDLASEYQAIIQYNQYAAQMAGPFRPQLAGILKAEIPDELRHADYLANKVATLGGDPAVMPPEPPSAEEPRAMVERVLEAENDAIRRYRERIGDADEFGETGLRVQLENMVLDETRHRDEMQRILAGWDSAAGR